MGAIVFCGREIGERADGVVCPRIVEGKGQLAPPLTCRSTLATIATLSQLHHHHHHQHHHHHHHQHHHHHHHRHHHHLASVRRSCQVVAYVTAPDCHIPLASLPQCTLTLAKDLQEYLFAFFWHSSIASPKSSLMCARRGYLEYGFALCLTII